MLGAALCVMGLSVSCTKDGNGNKEPEPVHPLVGTYRLASYEVTDKPSGEDAVVANFPVSGPLYAVWKSTDEAEEAFTENMEGIFRMMGGALIPQLLNTIELKADGYIGASYVAEPEVKTDKLMTWAMGAMFSTTYPTIDEVTADAATGGFVNTAAEEKTVSWTEQGGKFTLKVDIDAILGEEGNEDISELVKQVLTMEPAAIKAMLATLLDESINNISDETIKQLQGWVLNGIPMTKEEKDGKVNIFLPKSAFDSMMTMRETGETDDRGDPVMKNDLKIVWDALSKAGAIPEDAAMAGTMIDLIGAYWEMTTDFALGLSLVKTE